MASALQNSFAALPRGGYNANYNYWAPVSVGVKIC